jgi:hypothetical protein
MATDLTPVTRLEKILANLTGEAYDITPVTRIEKLFDNLLDGSYALIPATRIEKFISDLKEAGYDLTAVTRIEKFLNKTAADAGLVPVTRLEKFLDAIEMDQEKTVPFTDLIDPDLINKYFDGNGNVTRTRDGMYTSKYFTVKPGTSVYFSTFPALYAITTCYIVFYDAEYNQIARDGASRFKYSWEVPAGAALCRVCFSTGDLEKTLTFTGNIV